MQAWFDFLSSHEKQLGKESVDKWLRPLKVVHFDSGNLYLEAKDSFQVLWFEEHVRPLIKQAFVNNNNRNIKVHITCFDETQSVAPKKKIEKPQPASFTLSKDALDANYTLDQFVAGESNALLFRLLDEIAHSKISLGSFNPIVLYGGAGTGKTHLLMALAQAFQKIGLIALYVRAETFTDHVVSAIRSSEMQQFRKHYRNVDVLLFDDIHILAKRMATQEEFFHTFNALHMAGKQMIFSSNAAPSLLEEIEARLISRFEWGIQLHLEKLQKNELKEVLIKRSQHLQSPLDDAAVEFIIEAFPANLPSISRALEALILRTHLSGKTLSQPISRRLAEELLKDLIESEQEQAVTPQKIIAAAAAYFGIRTEDILGKSHAQEFALPRQIAMHLCRTQLNLPFMKIGAVFSRDHSTVMSSVKQVQQRLDQFDHETASAIAEIQFKLG
ncbi:MAG: chromosomal replication initiator protein DnaA [Verrucomicrobia bacterium]|nr:chromosomal replication initiator protein DnaA [Verrucomicrobiota bacterium]